jgi:outer membrane lipoprotein carrier protein
VDHRTAFSLIKRGGRLKRQLNVVWAAALLAVAPLMAAAGVSELIQRVEDRYNHAKTLSVQFVEEYDFEGHRRPAESGTLILKKAGKMRWDYTQPEGKVFVSDGRNVYLYLSGDNKVEKVPLKATEDMRAPLAFLLGRLDLKKEFGDFQAHPGEGGTWLEALAKTNQAPYERVEMLIGPEGAIHKLKIEGRDGSVLSFAFRDEKLNLPVGDSVFHFVIPPGAEVVDSIDFAQQER